MPKIVWQQIFTSKTALPSVLKFNNDLIHVSLGLFNGNGGNQVSNVDNNFLVIHRLTFLLLQSIVKWRLGYSISFRKTRGMKFKKLIGDGLPFSGNDVRWGVESFWQTKNWQSQFEYIETSLNQERAWGYYWLVALHLSPKNQLVIYYDKFSDLNHASTDAPWVILGYNRLFHQHKLKLMVDTCFQTDRPKREIQSTIQLQLFFH